MRKLWLAVAVFGAVTACGGDSGSAKTKCRNLVKTYCDRVTSCATQGGLVTSAQASSLHADCAEAVGDEVRCDDVIDLNDNFGQCLRDVSTLDCDEVNSALADDGAFISPVSCEQAVLWSE